MSKKITINNETLELLAKYKAGEVPDLLLKQPAVEEITSLSASTLEQTRLKGGGIPFVRIGRSVRYKLSDVAHYIQSLPSYRSTTEADAA